MPAAAGRGADADLHDGKAAIQALYDETLRAAAAALGGVQALALRLRVDAGLLRRWLAGESEPPLSAFMDMLDIIEEAPWRSYGAPEVSARSDPR